MYRLADSDIDQMIVAIMLENVFGIHNLTSDAEGEEMLMVPRSKVIEIYNPEYDGDTLYELFGSKCLPDNVATSASNVDDLEPKKSRCEKCGAPNSSICAHMNCQDYKLQSELKFCKDDKFRYKKNPGEVYTVDHITDDGRVFYWDKDPDGLSKACIVNPDYIELYTEPEASTCTQMYTDNCSSQYSRQDFDSIIKDGFSKERRLNIAVMIAQGILSCDLCQSPDTLAKSALHYADALIKEVEKGDNK